MTGRSTAPKPVLYMLAGLTALWPSVALSETLTRSLSYFTIGGVTPLEIEQQLLKLGPQINGSSTRHPGATRMEFTSRIVYAKLPGDCRISQATVAIKATVTLPRWRRKASADVGSRLFWDALSTDIVRHEEAHLVIARNFARQLERGLVDLRGEANCTEMATTAQALQDRILSRHDAEQQRFDRIEAKSLDRRLLAKLKRRIDQMTNREPSP